MFTNTFTRVPRMKKLALRCVAADIDDDEIDDIDDCLINHQCLYNVMIFIIFLFSGD